MAWCLLKSKAKELKQAIADGKVDIYELKDMTSAQRREFFKQWVGEEDARQINIEYERQLTKKNYEKAMVNWAKKITGMKPQAKRDLQTRIQNMIKRGELTADNYEQKMDDLIAYRLGAALTTKEANKIVELSNKVKDLEQYRYNSKEERLNYGRALNDLQDYATELSTTVPKTPGKFAGQVVIDTLNAPRSIMASTDVSFLGNQGLLLMPTKIYWQTVFGVENGVNLFKSFTKDGYEQVQAYVLTDPNYDLARRAGLRISSLSSKLSKREETFMSNIADQIPGFGKVITGSERTFTAFMNQLRLATFNKWVLQAQLRGEDTRDGSKTVKDIAKGVNMLTGSADLGRFEDWTPALNTVFFAPRKTAATFQLLAQPLTMWNKSPTARKMILSTIFNYFTGYGLLLALAKFYPDDDWFDAELDPRSVNFLRLKIGGVWVDGSWGIGRLSETAYVGLLGGLYNTLFPDGDKTLFGKKNSETGVINPHGNGLYDTNGLTEILRFTRNKLSPILGALMDILSGTDYKGDKVTISKTARDLVTPMALASIIDWTVEALNSDVSVGSKISGATEAVLGAFGLNAYHVTNVPNWHDSTSQEMTQLREKIGDKELTKAEQLYATLYSEKLDKLIKTKEYRELDNDGKSSAISSLKNEVKKSVFKRYDFKPVYAKKNQKSS